MSSSAPEPLFSARADERFVRAAGLDSTPQDRIEDRPDADIAAQLIAPSGH